MKNLFLPMMFCLLLTLSCSNEEEATAPEGVFPPAKQTAADEIKRPSLEGYTAVEKDRIFDGAEGRYRLNSLTIWSKTTNSKTGKNATFLGKGKLNYKSQMISFPKSVGMELLSFETKGDTTLPLDHGYSAFEPIEVTRTDGTYTMRFQYIAILDKELTKLNFMGAMDRIGSVLDPDSDFEPFPDRDIDKDKNVTYYVKDENSFLRTLSVNGKDSQTFYIQEWSMIQDPRFQNIITEGNHRKISEKISTLEGLRDYQRDIINFFAKLDDGVEKAEDFAFAYRIATHSEYYSDVIKRLCFAERLALKDNSKYLSKTLSFLYQNYSAGYSLKDAFALATKELGLKR